ncbi:hypothetical protein REH65_31215 [Saccharopolyspora sp. ID03-671]|uniref:hypothetical protein n=1 Tax=Saccharopolyspora sp. ID03-671 TaxID=3073066 RepID=UPI00324EBA51
MFEAIFAVFLIGVTFIVLNHLPPFLDALIERVRPHEVAVAQPEDDDENDHADDEKK